MEILISIGIFALGVVIGAVVMAAVFAKRYSCILDDIYNKGVEIGQKEERQKWLRIQEKVFDTARESKQ